MKACQMWHWLFNCLTCDTYHLFGFHVIFQTGEGRQFSLFPRTRFCGSMNVEMVWQRGWARRFQYQVENGRVINSVDTNRFRSVHYIRWTAKTRRGFRAAALRHGISYCTGNSCTFSNCERRFNRPNLVTYEWYSCRLLLVLTEKASI